MNIHHGVKECEIFKISVWDRRKEILFGNGLLAELSQNNRTPEWEVNGTECYEG